MARPLTRPGTAKSQTCHISEFSGAPRMSKSQRKSASSLIRIRIRDIWLDMEARINGGYGYQVETMSSFRGMSSLMRMMDKESDRKRSRYRGRDRSPTRTPTRPSRSPSSYGTSYGTIGTTGTGSSPYDSHVLTTKSRNGFKDSICSRRLRKQKQTTNS